MDNESKKDEIGFNKGLSRMISNIVVISIGIALGLMLFSLTGCSLPEIPNLEEIGNIGDLPTVTDTPPADTDTESPTPTPDNTNSSPTDNNTTNDNSNNNTNSNVDNDDEVVTPPVSPDEPAIEYVDVPTGWKVDRNGDYSKLKYKEALEVFNDMILYCKDSQGKMITIRSGSGVPVSSVDNIAAVFTDTKITLSIRDLTIELIKK